MVVSLPLAPPRSLRDGERLPYVSMSATSGSGGTDLPPEATARGRIGELLVLCGLTGFAITQPVLSVLGEEPEFFTFRRSTGVAIVATSLLIALVPATVLWLCTFAVGRIRPLAGWVLHLTIVAGLVAVAMLQVTKQYGLESPIVQLGISTAFGLTAAALYARFDVVARWARYTAVLPVLAVVSFLLLSPVSVLFESAATVNSAGSSGDEPSVVMLVLDELPTASLLDDERQIDAVRFPNFASLAQDATWYRNHTTVATGTRQAVPAMLTGREPEDLAPVLADHPDNLFTLLAPSHDLHVSESMTNLCDFQGCGVGEPPGLLEQIDRILSGAADVMETRVSPGPADTVAYDDFAEVLASDVPLEDADDQLRAAPERFDEFLTTIQPTDEPALWYQHLLLPHQPWRTYPDGTQYVSDTRLAQGGGADWLLTLHQQRHLLQAQYTDALLGRLLDRLKEADLYDDSVVVVVADHGIAFREGVNSRLWSDAGASGIAFSPLLVKAPGQTAGTIDDRNVLGFDVLPTIAGLVGRDVPWAIDGASAASDAIDERSDEKVIFDFGAAMLPTERTVNRFHTDGHLPSAQDRRIRSRTAAEPPLTGLVEQAGAAPWIGQHLDTLVTDAGGEVDIEGIAALEDPRRSSRSAVVTGELTGIPRGPGRILVAVNGTVVTGAPVIVPIEGRPWFRTLLPLLAFTDPEPTIRVAWVAGEAGVPETGVTEVTIRR